MTYNPRIHHRRSIRLQNYDYTQAGAYFVTICTHRRECLFGEIVDGKIQLSLAGQAVMVIWQNLPNHFANVELDEFVVMPNHAHAIIVIVDIGIGAKYSATHLDEPQGTSPNTSPLQNRARGTRPRSLSAIVQNFKSMSTRKINGALGIPGRSVWQRNYYEHIIRNAADLNRIRQYIASNPNRWALDKNNPNKEQA